MKSFANLHFENIPEKEGKAKTEHGLLHGENILYILLLCTFWSANSGKNEVGGTRGEGEKQSLLHSTTFISIFKLLFYIAMDFKSHAKKKEDELQMKYLTGLKKLFMWVRQAL